MPHDVMNTIHETGMPGSYHWLFWAVVVVVIALLLFLAWRFSNSKDKRVTTGSCEKLSSTEDQSDSDKGGNNHD